MHVCTWVTNPMLRLRELEYGQPLKAIVPVTLPLTDLVPVKERRPPSIVRRVVFPLPDGPSNASISPGQTTPFIYRKQKIY